MELGKKMHQLRKMSGLTQEQLAEKLGVSRQTISKWESGSSVPDLESMVRFCRLFQVSLDDLLEEEESMAEKSEKLNMEDLMEINRRSRKMTLLLTGGLIFLMVGVLAEVFVVSLRTVILSLEYMLYRYMVTGKYEYFPVDYQRLQWPGIIAGLIGLILCGCYLVERKRRK